MMADAIAMWRAEHADYSRLLDILEEQLAAYHAGSDPDYRLMLDIVSYLQEFPDRFHHPREDVAFAMLIERDPALQLPINRLLQEHRVIAATGEALVDRLTDILEGMSVARAALEAPAALYLVYYRHHIATEEREILPRAAKLLTPADWGVVAGAVSSRPDSLFGERFEERYRELRERIAKQSRPR
jgi:hemerythrin-like domain-containing protein